MKRLLLTLAFFSYLCNNSYSQDIVKKDTLADMMYMNVNPIRYVYNRDSVVRMYCRTEGDAITGNMTVVYQLRCKRVIDPETSVYDVVIFGRYVPSQSSVSGWDNIDKSYWFYDANTSQNLGLTFKNQ